MVAGGAPHKRKRRFPLSDNNSERSVGQVLVERMLAGRVANSDNDAVRQLTAEIHRQVEPWGVYLGVCRTIAEYVVAGQIDRQWVQRTIDQIRTQLDAGEIRTTPGRVFTAYTKNKFARDVGVPWHEASQAASERRRDRRRPKRNAG